MRADPSPPPLDTLEARAQRTRTDLRAMLFDGFAFSIMVGIGESYIAPFALALGMGDVTAALVATAPMLAGGVLQLITPAAVGWLGSHRRWVVLCASLQAASFLPLASAALAGSMSIWLLFATASLYWGLGLAASPAWNTWAGTIVPASVRVRFFARRSRWSQAALLLGLIAGGGVLQLARERELALAGYVVAFGVAFAARAISAFYLSRQSEPAPVPIGDTRVSPAAIREHLRSGGHGRLLAYLLTFQVSVYVAAPYFTPYMLGPLGYDYVGFTALTGAAFLARVIALPLLGRVTKRAGTRRVLVHASAWIVPLPVAWLVSDSFVWLFAVQLWSGVAWAAFELASLLSFFEHIPERMRTSILSAYNLANAVAIVIGSVAGGFLLDAAGGGATAYAMLLFASAAARLAALPLLRGAPDVSPASDRPPALRTIALRPSAGALQRPVLSTLDDGEESDDALESGERRSANGGG